MQTGLEIISHKLRCRLQARVRLPRDVLRRFSDSRSGGLSTAFAVSMVTLSAVAGIAIDYSKLHNLRESLQSAADAGALAGANELTLADFSREDVPAVVRSVVLNFANSNIGSHTLTDGDLQTVVQDNPLQVEVRIEKSVGLLFGSFIGADATRVDVKSVARIVGRPNICVLALEQSAPAAVALTINAKLTGNDCAVFSNSSSNLGLSVQDGAKLEASTVCSAGGVQGNGDISPAPFHDCPQFTDPLAARPEPASAHCDHMATIIAARTVTLRPGVYCLGLSILGTSKVTFEPGVYTIRNGPFLVAGASEITGDGVGFYLQGTAFFTFDPLTFIELSAPKDGPLAGLLFFGSRSQDPLLVNTILSDRARTMTGTIYLPRNTFVADSLARIGAQSAYTAIVTRRLVLMDGPHLVLNANYSETDVPVPDAIKGAGNAAVLVE